MTTDEIIKLLAVGSGVSAVSAVAVETIIRPYALRLMEPLRGIVLRLAPLAVCTALTIPLFPVAVLYLAPSVNGAQIKLSSLFAIGVVGGVGSAYAHGFWKWAIPEIKIWIRRKVGNDG